jgi:hypothetical protein
MSARAVSRALAAAALAAGALRAASLEEAAGRRHLADLAWETRTGELRVRVLDARGQPLPGARVEAEITAPAFALGRVFTRAEWDRLGPEAQAAAGRHFGLARIEEEAGWREWDRPGGREEQGAHWSIWLDELRAAGFQITASALVRPGWHRRNPPGLRELPPEWLADRVRNRVTELASLGAGRVAGWDVVHQARMDRDFAARLGEAETARWFAALDQADPVARAGFGEYALLTAPAAAVQDVLGRWAAWRAAGARVDTLRLEFDAPPAETWALTRARENLDRLTAAGLRLEVTHFPARPDSHAIALGRVVLRHPGVMALYVVGEAESPTIWPPALPRQVRGTTDRNGEWRSRLVRGRGEVRLQSPLGAARAILVLDAESGWLGLRAPGAASPTPSVSASQAREERRQTRSSPPPPAGPVNLDRR